MEVEVNAALLIFHAAMHEALSQRPSFGPVSQPVHRSRQLCTARPFVLHLRALGNARFCALARI